MRGAEAIPGLFCNLDAIGGMGVFIIFHWGWGEGVGRGGGERGGGGGAILFACLAARGGGRHNMAPRGRMPSFSQQLCHLHSSIDVEL